MRESTKWLVGNFGVAFHCAAVLLIERISFCLRILGLQRCAPQDFPSLWQCFFWKHLPLETRAAGKTPAARGSSCPYLQSVMQRTALTSGRSSTMKPLRLGICTFGMLAASMTASAGTSPLRLRRYADTAYTSSAVSVCGDRKSTRLNSSHLVISYAV